MENLQNIFQPNNLEEVKRLLMIYPKSLILAGGTDLILALRRKEISADTLIDLKNISELRDMTFYDDKIVLGSMVTFTDLIENEQIKHHLHSIYVCAKTMGSPQIRNIATIGGNLIYAQAAADIIPCLMSLDAMFLFESTDNERIVNVNQYFQNFEQEKITKEEVLTKIIIPTKQQLTGFYKLGKRNSLAIARMSCAIRLVLDENRIKDVAISLGAVGRHPYRAKDIEFHAVGNTVDWLSSVEVLKLLEDSVYESIKGRQSMPFKKEAIKGVYQLALKNTMNNGVIS